MMAINNIADGTGRESFHFNTGVKPGNFGNDKYDNEANKPFRKLMANERVDSAGVLVQDFQCDDVPKGAKFAGKVISVDDPSYKPEFLLFQIAAGHAAGRWAVFTPPVEKSEAR